MKFIHSLFFLICCALAVVGCEGEPSEQTDADQTADASGGPADADNLPDTDADEDSTDGDDPLDRYTVSTVAAGKETGKETGDDGRAANDDDELWGLD